MNKRKLLNSEISMLSKVIGENVNSETFICNENGYKFFRCFDMSNSFTIGETRLYRIAVSNKKEKTSEYKDLLELLKHFE